MTTDRLVEANRLNAQKSTGPKSEATRQTSSRNSTRHGLLAKAISLEGEAPEAFQQFLEALYNEFQPASHHESALIDTMALSHWRKMRIVALEGASINHQIREQYLDMDLDKDGPIDSTTHAALAVQSLARKSNLLALLNRYETTFTRQYCKAHNMLMQGRTQQSNKRRGDDDDNVNRE